MQSRPSFLSGDPSMKTNRQSDNESKAMWLILDIFRRLGESVRYGRYHYEDRTRPSINLLDMFDEDSLWDTLCVRFIFSQKELLSVQVSHFLSNARKSYTPTKDVPSYLISPQSECRNPHIFCPYSVINKISMTHISASITTISPLPSVSLDHSGGIHPVYGDKFSRRK